MNQEEKNKIETDFLTVNYADCVYKSEWLKIQYNEDCIILYVRGDANVRFPQDMKIVEARSNILGDKGEYNGKIFSGAFKVDYKYYMFWVVIYSDSVNDKAMVIP